jgi:predicted GIY-YIG superfamily endonuclease
VGRYCVYLLAAGGGIAYAGSSGRMEKRLRRHFRGYSSAAVRGLRPDAAYVLACTRSKPLALAWEAWLHKAYRPPYAARASAERPRKPPHPPPGWYTLRAAVYEPSLPPPGRYRPPHPPPELRPSAKTWDGVRDGSPGAQEASAESARGFYLGGFAYTDRLCPAAWVYDLQVQTCRCFLTGVVRPVSLYLWGSTYVRGPWRTARGVKSLQFIMYSGIYHGHG